MVLVRVEGGVGLTDARSMADSMEYNYPIVLDFSYPLDDQFLKLHYNLETIENENK